MTRQTGDRERIRDRARKAALTQRWRAVSACTRCGIPTTRFKRCLTCRRRQAKWALAWYYKAKAEQVKQAA